MIVPTEIKEAQRHYKKQSRAENQSHDLDREEVVPGSPLIKSHVTLSECDEQSLQMESQISQPVQQVVQVEKEKMKQTVTSNDDGATLQLQNYIRSVDDSDLNFLQDSMLLS